MSKVPQKDAGALFAFIAELETRRVAFRLDRVRESIMVVVAVPGERWEVEFFETGRVEIERFRSDGKIDNEAALSELWELAQ